jgi:hypothetical protein
MTRMRATTLLLTAVLLTNMPAWAFRLPTQMTPSQQRSVTETLAFGSSAKHLTNPFPLGGYSGFEIGVSHQILDASDVAILAGSDGTGRSLGITQLGIAKGVYGNMDFHFNFSPWATADGLTSAQGLVKWGFYQADFLPLNAALSAHFTHFTIDSAFTSTTIGGDLLTGLNFTNLAFYLGLGFLDATGNFAGGVGAESTTLSGSTERVRVKRLHGLVGASYHLDPLFVVLQADRYRDLVFSTKVGLRF